MYVLSLDGDYKVRSTGLQQEIVGHVPGVIHTDLLRANIIEDPYVGNRELDYKWIYRSDWTYERSFSIPSNIKDTKMYLQFDGIDTIATIKLNNHLIGTTNNMFRDYTFEISPSQLQSDNKLEITIHSPVPYAKTQASKSPYFIPHQEYPNSELYWNYVRKAACHFGWDWGPNFCTGGVYRSVRFIAGDAISQVTTQQAFEENQIKLTGKIFSLSGKSEGKVVLKKGDKEIKMAGIHEGKFEMEVPKDQVELWWPVGYGNQPLYTLHVSCTNNVTIKEMSMTNIKGNTCEKTVQIGFRTIELIREPDTVIPSFAKNKGESFYFKVNGVPIFAKGSDWIPADCFDSRVTTKRLHNLLQSVLDANMNALRVWGGGIYEQDEFYNFCNEKGILIWQDFMFSCACYPANKEFLQNVAQETIFQVRRLSNHPCIALWCGNNENEEGLGWYDEVVKQNRDRYVVDYTKLYIDTIYEILLQEDPQRAYWPSSPSNGIQEWGVSNQLERGDAHYWAVWHGNKPFTEYMKIAPRFLSEFGFQSFPSLQSLKTVLTEEEDFNITSPAMEFRQRSPIQGNKAIMEHIARHFRIPSKFEDWIYLSQILQGLSIKAGIEHWRRLMPYTMGTLYWQLNDIWPGPSWSSLEYNGQWKVLHHYAQHFYAPVLVSCFEEEEKFKVYITSDLTSSVNGELEVEVWTFDATMAVKKIKHEFSAEKLKSASIWEISTSDLLGELAKTAAFVTISITTTNGHNSQNTYFFAPLKQSKLLRPTINQSISTTAEGHKKIELDTDVVAPFVYLTADKSFGRFSDNGFLLLPGKKRTVYYYLWNEQKEFDLNVKSLRDVY